jgi:murein DD-endopeptidase MepM/ murein hydrolase activator NlpD
MIIIEKEYNVQTGEETIFEREETSAEMELRLKYEAEFEKEAAETAAKETAKVAAEAKLKVLGLTQTEDLSGFRSVMVNPVPNYKVTTPYKREGKWWKLGYHTGIDYRAPQAHKCSSCSRRSSA